MALAELAQAEIAERAKLYPTNATWRPPSADETRARRLELLRKVEAGQAVEAADPFELAKAQAFTARAAELAEAEAQQQRAREQLAAAATAAAQASADRLALRIELAEQLGAQARRSAAQRAYEEATAKVRQLHALRAEVASWVG